LDLSCNSIERLESKAFGNLPVVFQLKLDNNGLNEISPFAFDGLLQLINLTLSGNKIVSLTSEAFKGLVSLQLLDLSNNKLTRLENKTHSLLEDLLSLERLNLSHNRLSYISPKSFPSSEYVPYKLRVLDLSHNSIESLVSTNGLTNVQNISLSHNRIRQIKSNLLANMTRLTWLDLSHNNLAKLTSGVFELSDKSGQYPLTSLTGVNLANNRLQEIPLREIVALKSLKSLNLSGNKLSRVPDEFAILSKRDVNINMTGNPFTCNCELRLEIDRVRINRKARVSVMEDDEESDGWELLVCNDPDQLRGRIITRLTRDELQCPLMDKDQESILDGDLVLRGTNWLRRDALYAVWLVRNITADIMSFQVTLQSEQVSSPCPHEQCQESVTLPYNSREYLFENVDSKKTYRVCVSATYSRGKSGDNEPRKHCRIASSSRN